MKSLAIIPLITAGALAIIAAALVALGLHVVVTDVVAAALVGGISGMLGLFPIFYGQPTDHLGASQLGLAGTVLHMLAALVMAGGLITLHPINVHGALPYWLIGGYWVSLMVTIVQLRRAILATPNSTVAKAEK